VPTTLDSELLRDLYGTDEVRAAFDAVAQLQGWLDVEAALAEAEAEAGVIPEAAAARIRAEARAENFDLAALRAEIEQANHPLVPAIRALRERCGEHSGWVHWGATTQDIVDTGLVLQIRHALEPLRRDLDRATRAAAELALRYADTPMAGRTHGQQAVPITFGLKAATWTDELDRCRTRLEGATRSILTAQLAGAAGTLATLGDQAAPVQDAFARRLELASPAVPWHATRDRPRDLCDALDEIASAAERIASEIVRLQSTEVAEVAEPAAEGQSGSSTMAQKRNPITSLYVVASARLLRAAASAVTGAPAHAAERDMGYWAIEWLALPQALILCSGVLDKLARVLEGLEVDADRMRTNLELGGGQIMAEAASTALAQLLGHDAARETVQKAVREAQSAQRSLADALAEDDAVSARLSRSELDALLEPSAYLGLSADTARATAQRILQ
jgi:adenylosuccinate lyase/3-carboxy-cis,cis-muconate cycloisomerase